MPTMGRYCKAYPLQRLQQFPGWPRQVPETMDQPEHDHYCFLQENYTVTSDIFLEDVIFDQVSDDWRRFCRETLDFVIPPEVADLPGGTPAPSR